MGFPKRKQNRLTEYDYSTPNAYFITVCTQNRKNLFWKDVGAAIGRPEDIPLTELGAIVQCSIAEARKIKTSLTVSNKSVTRSNEVQKYIEKSS